MPDAETAAPSSALHVVVMGVAGSGKSVLAALLAERLGLALVEGDDFHSARDIEMLRAGTPLTDADRLPWLQQLGEEMRSRPEGAVLTCAALKRVYRDALRTAVPSLRFLHLALSAHQAMERLAARTDHFYPPSLAGADVEALEDPRGEPRVHTLDATLHVDRLLEESVRWLVPAFNNA